MTEKIHSADAVESKNQPQINPRTDQYWTRCLHSIMGYLVGSVTPEDIDQKSQIDFASMEPVEAEILATYLFTLIPDSCSFAITTKVMGKQLTIPPLCTLNPSYDISESLHFQAYTHLSENDSALRPPRRIRLLEIMRLPELLTLSRGLVNHATAYEATPKTFFMIHQGLQFVSRRYNRSRTIS